MESFLHYYLGNNRAIDTSSLIYYLNNGLNQREQAFLQALMLNGSTGKIVYAGVYLSITTSERRFHIAIKRGSSTEGREYRIGYSKLICLRHILADQEREQREHGTAFEAW